MAYQLGMDKTLAIKNLRQSGLSQQAIADALGISRGAVIRHLAVISPNSTEALTGSDCLGTAVQVPSSLLPSSRTRFAKSEFWSSELVV